MNRYITGTVIRQAREAKNMTQAELAQKLCVSDKAVSKWETGRSYPDITLIEPIASALGLSSIELLSGDTIQNKNRSFNMTRCAIYVCPVCGNVIVSAGETVVSCCGIVLPALEAENAVENCPYKFRIEQVEDEYYVSFDHPMTKDHYISFMMAVSGDRYELVKLYPEGACEARFKKRLVKYIYYYCNKHGLHVKKTV